MKQQNYTVLKLCTGIIFHPKICHFFIITFFPNKPMAGAGKLNICSINPVPPGKMYYFQQYSILLDNNPLHLSGLVAWRSNLIGNGHLFNRATLQFGDKTPSPPKRNDHGCSARPAAQRSSYRYSVH